MDQTNRRHWPSWLSFEKWSRPRKEQRN